MTNMDHTRPETKRDVELAFDELEAVPGGTRKSAGSTATGVFFLHFTFKLVAVK